MRWLAVSSPAVICRNPWSLPDSTAPTTALPSTSGPSSATACPSALLSYYPAATTPASDHRRASPGQTAASGKCQSSTSGGNDHGSGTSLTGAFLCTRAQVRHMLHQGRGGAIVNVSSGAGRKGFQGQAACAAAKHGVIGFTRSAALGHAAAGIRINADCPGISDTETIRRLGDTRPGGREGLIADEPVGRLGRRPWSSTAARPPDPPGPAQGELRCSTPAAVSW
ncbi:SDR family NAD(P)-dependent oxidoreductase [Streptomyces seoulensis]